MGKKILGRDRVPFRPIFENLPSIQRGTVRGARRKNSAKRTKLNFNLARKGLQ